jgi:NADH-quinone oxidoreductase subunit L
MDVGATLSNVLLVAWLLPLASFALIVLFGPKMGPHGKNAGYIATGAIVVSCALSIYALAVWVKHHPIPAAHQEHASEDPAASGHAAESHADHPISKPAYYHGDWYPFAEFGKLRLTIGYYIDALTVLMFAMVTFIASCIHFYAQGYMHEELHDVTDHEVTLADGHHLHRRGRYHRFFQYLSLFCFSMLGIVVAGNMAMVFMFWELVGVCSYFLIGFYIERHSASTAANKAFIVNRVGDFGMLIGMMILWTTLGTFHFGGDDGIFAQVRPGADQHLTVPAGMLDSARAAGVTDATEQHTYGYWLLVAAGLGIFCGCVGKSAQFPLHTWLPDAMEGPTPVSALVHSATMVAAGVYLTGRFYPVFAPEVLLVIAIVGCVTLFIAATIAITAVDIKRVLAYSTVSQLGYMMFALGVGGWVAGMLHLITHAFFKSLLFLCSGSVIHAVHTNDMTHMGGLRRKMPYTAYTMLVGCLAIIGAGIPLVIGLSGYYSKDAILAQALSFQGKNPLWGAMFFVAAGGAAITAFYMFRLWYMTFAGEPRDHHRYDHAHESPKVMYVPLVVLAVFAVAVVWPTFEKSPLVNVLNQGTPLGTSAGGHGELATALDIPAEHDSHAEAIHVSATMYAFVTALGGFLLATLFYGWRVLDPREVKSQFKGIYNFLWHKWWFDELYDALLVRPTHWLAAMAAWLDKNVLDRIIDGSARFVVLVSRYDDWFDRLFVDGLVNASARLTYSVGLSLRALQTGRLRQYVMFIVIGTVVLFVLISALRNVAAG